jgi:dihydroflavonol-4-reductase
MNTFVTGGTGFVGSMLVRKLVEAGHNVRLLARPTSNLRQLKDLPVEITPGDLSDVECLRRSMQDCEWVFHVAALYSYWGHPWEEFYQSNIVGTRNALQAAGEASVQRIVYTSSIAALGLPTGDQPANEETPVNLADKIGFYKQSKYQAEQVALEFARQGLPVVIVNPAAPVGVGDYKPTDTGQMIVDFLHGRMFGYVDTGMNIVDVEDVATGHLLAAERGRLGEKYILGGENLSLKQVLDLLSEVSGLPQVRLHIPHSVALGWSYVDTALARLNPHHIPSATPDKVRLSRQKEYYDSSKAVRELGFPQTPARQALRKAVEWYRANEYAS